MHSPLDIPLEQPATTRRADRRVVLLCVTTIIGLFFGYLASRVPYVVAETVGLRPEDTTMSIRLLKTPANANIIQQQFGKIVPLNGLPLSLAELLQLSDREISIHSNARGITAVSIDTELPEDTKEILENFGYHAWIGSNKSLITLIDAEVHDTAARFVFGAFLPWYDGEVTIRAEREQRASIFLGSHQLTINGVGSPGSVMRNASIPQDSAVILATSMAENLLGILAVTQGTAISPALAQFTSDLSINGGSIVLTEDSSGQGFFATFPAPALTIENAAAIGKDLANRQNISTRLLRSEDGESFQELFADNSATRVDISAEQDFTFITITNAQNEILRLTKTQEMLTIANRAIAVADTLDSTSSCLLRAHTWVDSQRFLTLIHPEIEYQNVFAHILANSGEVAVTATKARICW